MASKAVISGSTDQRQPETDVEERLRFSQSTSEQEIRQRAYEIYLKRGGQPGSELEDWLQQHNRKLWAFRVMDKFGDSGLTGVLSVEMQSGIARIVDFVLSCRVIGRRVEDAMVAFAAEYCAAAGLEELHANYLPTAENKPCLSFWVSSGFSYDEEENRFGWLLSKPYPFPKGVGIHRPQTGGTSQSQQRVSRESEGVVLPVFTSSD